MARCRRHVRSGLTTVPALVLQLLIAVDMSLTFTGILHDSGVEANPLFSILVSRGVVPMLVGMTVYVVLVWAVLAGAPQWLRAAVIGALTGLHVYGVLTWVWFLFLPSIEFVFQPFWTAAIVGVVGVTATLAAYVDLGTCPVPWGRSTPSNIQYREYVK